MIFEDKIDNFRYCFDLKHAYGWKNLWKAIKSKSDFFETLRYVLIDTMEGL